jgi:hypothetical protein
MELSKNILIDSVGRPEFRKHPKSFSWQPKKGKGWNRDAKKSSFGKTYESRVGKKGCVYAFWSGNRCEYVGRTKKGKGRPQAHFNKYWFSKVTRIDIWVAKDSVLPKLECLAMDLFDPVQNDIKAARRKFTSKCPVCSVVEEIREDLRSLFRLR